MKPEKAFNFDAEQVRSVIAGQLTKIVAPVKNKFYIPPSPQADINGWRALIRKCPFGQVGDRIWVRETWRIGAWREEQRTVAIDYLASPQTKTPWITVPEDAENYHGDGAFEKYWNQSIDDCIKAGLQAPNDRYHWEPGESPCRIRPSTHMPRWASRITLEITGVTVDHQLSPEAYQHWKDTHERFQRPQQFWIVEFKVVEIKRV